MSGGADVGRRAAVRSDTASVRKDLAGVLEDDHSVAEKAPALLGKRRHNAGCVVIECISGRTGRLVLAHQGSPGWGFVLV
jgi:hypothetical protein